jgi:hypothetical protein
VISDDFDNDYSWSTKHRYYIPISNTLAKTSSNLNKWTCEICKESWPHDKNECDSCVVKNLNAINEAQNTKLGKMPSNEQIRGQAGDTGQ